MMIRPYDSACDCLKAAGHGKMPCRNDVIKV